MESNPTGAPRASSAVKDNRQPVMMKADEEKAAATVPTGDEKQDHDAKLETGSNQPVKLPERQRTIHGIKVLSSHFLQTDPMWVLLVVAILSNLCFYAIDNTIVAVIQPVYPSKANKYRFSLLFVVGSIICGAAPNMTALIFGRVIGGVGGTGMYLGALTLISVNTSPKETTEYMGYLALVWGFGSVIGPLIGGAFTDSSATWRWLANYCFVCSFWSIIHCPIPAAALQLLDYSGASRAANTSSQDKRYDYMLLAVALIVPVPLYYIPVFFQLAKGDSALRAGVKTLPLICFWVTSSAIRGRLMGKLGWYQPWYIAGSILNILAGVFLSRINITTSDAVIYGLQVLSGVGTGCYGQAGFAVAQRLAPPTDIHRAISLMLIAQLTGTTLGLAIAGAIFQNVSLPRVRQIVPSFSASQLSNLITQIGGGLDDQLNEVQTKEVLTIIVDALTDTYILIYAAAALSLVLSVFFTPKKLW
ncbi:hypothetical protein BGAL_0444g00030 [Botrytis galanthina]|uniref:Major facilitator superfamily (MFS) profile domain-containing protein n=1 Tax=Botrytis galanthina TaxID=278940 RepID=A0A4S8QLG3_9HELO|nr:hypothetical protein BGAL_0444g00030 [Botrytis galanthina]